MKNILLISSGLSPQVITESLYFFNQKKSLHIDEIHVITDSTGSILIEKNLFSGPKWYNQYLKDYNIDKSSIKFKMANIHSLKDENGNPLKDLLTLTANTSAVNQIFKIVEKLTKDENNRLITNVAGGRKTMSVIIGQAMQFFGREADLLTHVIIDEKFLRLPDFYYPSPNKMIKDINGHKIDYSKINIYLHELPFIRLRPILGKLLKVTTKTSLIDLVSIAQKHIDDLIKPVTLSISKIYSKVTVNDISFSLPKKDMAVYITLLSLIIDNYSEKNSELGFISIDKMIERKFLNKFINFYEKLHSPYSVLVTKEKERISEDQRMQQFYTNDWLQETRSKINRVLKTNLPPHLYAITQIITSGEYGYKSYGIPLQKDSIDLSSFDN